MHSSTWWYVDQNGSNNGIISIEMCFSPLSRTFYCYDLWFVAMVSSWRFCTSWKLGAWTVTEESFAWLNPWHAHWAKLITKIGRVLYPSKFHRHFVVAVSATSRERDKIQTRRGPSSDRQEDRLLKTQRTDGPEKLNDNRTAGSELENTHVFGGWEAGWVE